MSDSEDEAVPTPPDHRLIITLGDTSDIDGFLALATYAQTGANVLFIMNYPGYIGGDDDGVSDLDYADHNQGMGFRYGAQQLWDVTAGRVNARQWRKVLQAFDASAARDDANAVYAHVLTNIAYRMCYAVWTEFAPRGASGKLYFGVGGINALLPVSRDIHKDEIYLYGPMTRDIDLPLITYTPGKIYEVGNERPPTLFDRDDTAIYMDFNGSAAFLSVPQWRDVFTRQVLKRLRGVFVMGGVLAEQAPTTLSARGVLNRLPIATFNQLYHPECTALLLDQLNAAAIPIYTVSNNAVSPFKDVELFLNERGLAGGRLARFARAYYDAREFGPPPKKAFDLYSATLLCLAMAGIGIEGMLEPRHLFYDDQFGIALLAEKPTLPSSSDATAYVPSDTNLSSVAVLNLRLDAASDHLFARDL